MGHSKPLRKPDISGFHFYKEIMDEEPGAGINFDFIMKHPARGYLLFEHLKCEERDDVDPYSSHPSRYWHKNSQKFIRLWEITRELCGSLYLVNYAEAGTLHENKVLAIRVLGMTEDGITKSKMKQFTKPEYSRWFKKINKECLNA